MKDTNELIAEFMGYVFVNGVYESPKDEFHIDEMLYHTSWDWLMPVVQKCYKIEDEEGFDNLVDAVATLDMYSTYNAVVEYIKQQNKNK